MTTIEQLQRIGYRVNGDSWAWNVYEDERGTVASDGQVECWGPDDELAAALSDLPAGATHGQIWNMLAGFPSNA